MGLIRKIKKIILRDGKFLSAVNSKQDNILNDKLDKTDGYADLTGGIYVSYDGLSTDLVFTVDTTKSGASASNQFKLSLRSGKTYNCRIYWGDDSYTDQTNDISPTHTYIGAGIKTIRIAGTFDSFHFNFAGDSNKITGLTQWGNIIWGADQSNSFYGCFNFVLSASDSPIWSNVTNMSGFFRASNFQGSQITKANNINTSNVTDMSFCFANNFVIDSSGTLLWNTANVTNMSNMFFNSTMFRNGSLSNLNTGNVTDMSSMFNFYGGSAFPAGITNWDVRKVTNMNSMFSSGGSNSIINISSWQPLALTTATNFMSGILSENFGAASDFLTSIYTNWSALTLQSGVNISFNTIKYKASASAGRSVLVSAPNNWVITDGGL